MQKNQIIDELVIQLTNNFSKSLSVNYQYKLAGKELLLFIENNNYGETEIIEWLRLNERNWYKGKFKAIKRIAYSYIAYNNNEFFPSQRFIYYNDQSTFLKLSKESQLNIINYIQRLNININNNCYIKNNVAHLYYYIEQNELKLDDFSLNDFYSFYLFEKSISKSAQNLNRILDTCSNYIVFKYQDNENMKLFSRILFFNYRLIFESIIKYKISFEINNNYKLENDFLKSINSFIEKTFDKSFYSKKTLDSYEFEINILFIFLNYFKLEFSNESIYLWIDFLKEINKKGIAQYRRVAFLFYSFVKTKTIKLIEYRKIIILNTNKINRFPDWAIDYVNNYLNLRKRYGFSNSTLCMDKNSIYRFVTFLDKNNITSFNDIKPSIINDFSINDIHSTIAGKNAYISRIRNFIKYLIEDEKVNINKNIIYLLNCGREKSQVVTVINDDDLNLIFKSKDIFTTKFELRAYAILMLGLKLGIRKSDIVNLKFENISYKDKTVRFIQQKTNKEIVLPLSIDVANAIYNYVKYARPSSSSNFIFLSVLPPYKNIVSNVCNSSFYTIQKKLNFKHIYKGFHITRKTFATRILSINNNVSTVSFLLGHSDNSTVDKYLSINKTLMNECGLSLTNISFGGFYD